MHLHTHTDSSYLTEPKSRSRTGGYHYFSDKPKLPILSTDPPPKHNHHVLVISKVLSPVFSSTQEAETGAGFHNAREAIPLRQTAIERGHPQGPTPLQFDNKCARGILTGELKQKHSKSMDMRFNWLQDRALAQQQFHIYWKRGPTNLGDYPTKQHPTKPHREQRHLYVLNSLQQTINMVQKTTQTVSTTCKGVLIANAPTLQGQTNKTVIFPNGHKLKRSYSQMNINYNGHIPRWT